MNEPLAAVPQLQDDLGPVSDRVEDVIEEALVLRLHEERRDLVLLIEPNRDDQCHLSVVFRAGDDHHLTEDHLVAVVAELDRLARPPEDLAKRQKVPGERHVAVVDPREPRRPREPEDHLGLERLLECVEVSSLESLGQPADHCLSLREHRLLRFHTSRIGPNGQSLEPEMARGARIAHVPDGGTADESSRATPPVCRDTLAQNLQLVTIPVGP